MTHQVHTATSVEESLVAKGIKTISHLTYSLDIAPANISLSSRVKSDLAGFSWSQDSFKISWEVIMWTIAEKDKSITAFQQWYERCNKYIHIADVNLEKI
jgi:hypothetical protein